MIRTRKLFFQLFICILSAFTLLLSGCGNKIEGTYKFKYMSYTENGMSIELEVGEKFMGMLTLNEDFAVLTLNADGTAVMTINSGSENESSMGTWAKAESKTIALKFDDETTTCSCDGKKIEFEMDGIKLILEK